MPTLDHYVIIACYCLILNSTQNDVTEVDGPYEIIKLLTCSLVQYFFLGYEIENP